MSSLAIPQRGAPTPSRGDATILVYYMHNEGLRLATVLNTDCRADLVDLFCHVRESCNIAMWSDVEVYIVPSTLVVGVAGRALASLRCHLGGDAGILHRVWPSGLERLIRIMSGCIGHLLRGGGRWWSANHDPEKQTH